MESTTKQRFSRYLLYAIGEILLVMIGILLAVRVNNWNQQRYEKAEELELVHNLLSDARADSVFFQSRIDGLLKFDSIYKVILDTTRVLEYSSVHADLLNNRLFTLSGGWADQSNLLINNPDAYKLVGSSELKGELRIYQARYEYVKKALETTRSLGREYGIPLDYKFHKLFRQIRPPLKWEDFVSFRKDETALVTIEFFRNQGQATMELLWAFQVSIWSTIQTLEIREAELSFD